MNLEEFRDFCLSLPKAEENAPWSEPEYQSLITFTVGGKWFTLLDADNKRCNIKAAPDTIADMLDRYNGAFPAWHMNKTHWLGVMLDSDIPAEQIKALLREGYELIVGRLTKAKRAELGL